MTVDQRKQYLHSNAWMHGYLLGTYRFEAGQGRVRVGTESVDGYVYVKGVVLTRRKIYVLDNDAPAVEVTGQWAAEANILGLYGDDILVSREPDQGDAAVTYPFSPIEPGAYKIFVWLPQLGEDAAAAFGVDVAHDGTQDALIVPTAGSRVGWMHLGQFGFGTRDEQFVRIRRSTAVGTVYADAVKLVRVDDEQQKG